jgi:hypothetical protein
VRAVLEAVADTDELASAWSGASFAALEERIAIDADRLLTAAEARPSEVLGWLAAVRAGIDNPPAIRQVDSQASSRELGVLVARLRHVERRDEPVGVGTSPAPAIDDRGAGEIDTVEEFARRMKMSESSVRRAMADGMPFMQPGGQGGAIRIDVNRAIQWLHARAANNDDSGDGPDDARRPPRNVRAQSGGTVFHADE